MNAKEAKEIVETLEHGMTTERIIELDLGGDHIARRYWTVRAQGYLDALEGPEIKELVEVLETVIEMWTNGHLDASEIADCKRAVSKYLSETK